MKKLWTLLLLIYSFSILASDWKSPINIKYQAKNPELYQTYEETFKLLNKWSGQNEKLMKAYENLTAIVKTDPEFAPAYREFGRLYIMSASNGSSYDTDMLEVARQQIQKSIDLEPDYADSFVLLGHLYTNLGQYKKGRESLEKARDIGTESPWLALNSAELYKIHNSFEKEREEYLSVIQSNTQNIKAKLVATTGMKKYYERLKDFKEADIWFEKSLEYSGHSAWTYGNHASSLLYKRGDYDGAILYAEKALKIMNYGNGRSILADALYSKWAEEQNKGNSKVAQESFDRAYDINPDIESVISFTKRYPGTKQTSKALQKWVDEKKDKGT